MDLMQKQLKFFVQEGLFDSAEIMGQLLIAAESTVPDLDPLQHAEHMVLLADAYRGKKEFRRALAQYRAALQLSSHANRPGIGRRSSFGRTSISDQPLDQSGRIDENEVKYRMAQCHLALGEPRAALQELETVPNRGRNLAINLCLARLYQYAGYDRAAIACHRECLRECPYMLECHVALAKLRTPVREIQDLLPMQPPSFDLNAQPTDGYDPANWLQTFVEGHVAAAGHEHRKARARFSELQERFPGASHLLLEQAKAEAGCGAVADAVVSFQKVRLMEPAVLESMDKYAQLLRIKDDLHELNKLTQELLTADFRRAESWVASAIFWEARDDLQKALTYADKAIRANDHHGYAFHVRASLCLSLGRGEPAIAAFRRALNLDASIETFEGLFRAYLSVCKHKEALVAAREAVKAMPGSARALSLTGIAYTHLDQNQRAHTQFERALAADPGCLEAVLGLAELYQMEDKLNEAQKLLQSHLEKSATETLHTRLAMVLSVKDNKSEALAHFQIALAKNPRSKDAKAGLARLEKLMKGLDPDADNEELEEEDEVQEAEDGEEGLEDEGAGSYM